MTREEAILNFAEWIKRDSEMVNVDIVDRLENIEIYKMAIKALEQEPFINKPCVSTEACKYDKNKVLDKIRAEIKEQADRRKDSLFGDGLRYALEIIDKYKAESEET